MKENVDYEWVELPSKGQCYPHKKNKCPIAYLTTKEENIISLRIPNLLDRLLESTILDSDFIIEDLCVGDKSALIIWLRKTSYGSILFNPTTNKSYDLNDLSYKEFNLVGDKDGYFEFKNLYGDTYKFRLLKHKDEIELMNEIANLSDDKLTDTVVDLFLLKSTMAINENTDRLFIEKHLKEQKREVKSIYFDYILTNTPNFKTFPLNISSIDDTLFTNINLYTIK